jgi:hypothetical protein
VKVLKKLFGRKERLSKERSPRIRLLLGDGARFETADFAFPLVNLSDTGMGLLAERDFPSGEVDGVIHLGAAEARVSVKKVRESGTVVGVRLIGDGAPLRSILRRHFQEELRATEMSLAKGRSLEGEEGHPLWYYAPGNFELFFVVLNGQVRRLELGWPGRVVTAEQGRPARLGHLKDEVREKVSHASSELIDWQREFVGDDLQKALRILENVQGLDPVQRSQLRIMIES